MKKRLAARLRRLAQRLDPLPTTVWPKVYTTTTSSSATLKAWGE